MQKDLCKNVPGSSIHNSLKLESTKMFIYGQNGWTSCVAFMQQKKEQALDTGYNMSESQEYVEEKKVSIKDCIVFDSMYAKFNIITSKAEIITQFTSDWGKWLFANRTAGIEIVSLWYLGSQGSLRRSCS